MKQTFFLVNVTFFLLSTAWRSEKTQMWTLNIIKSNRINLTE